MLSTLNQKITGCVLGVAIGDALGLPYEGLCPSRMQRMFPQLDRYHLVFGKGLTSDDTEHTCMVMQSLLIANGNTKTFAHNLGWRMRWWLIGLPAGIGWATLRSILKLWLGFSPQNSGVFSAGNGPGMRSPILGVVYGHDPNKLIDFVRASTLLTHRDPKALVGALAIALAAFLSSHSATITPTIYTTELKKLLELFQKSTPDSSNRANSESNPAIDSKSNPNSSQPNFSPASAKSNLEPQAVQEMLDIVQDCVQSVQSQESTPAYTARILGRHGVSGYIYHTVPAVLHAWLSHPEDFSKAMLAVIQCGGDTDTTAAILGGILGARVGKDAIPHPWQANFWEWPRTLAWLQQLGHRLSQSMEQQQPSKSLGLCWPGLFLRNLCMIPIVLCHGLRRLFPPFG